MTIWIAATDGTSGGSGTFADPYDIDTLIGVSSPVSAGDQIWLRAGTYSPLSAGGLGDNLMNGSAVAGKGVYTMRINGSSGNNIVIRNYPNEAVRINGAIHIVSGQASYLTIRNLEIAPTATTRSFATEGEVDIPGNYVSGTGCWYDANYIHDMVQMYVYGTGGFTFTNNIIGRCGVVVAGGARGYGGLYTHNNPGGAITIKKNIFIGGFNGYNFGAQSAGANGIKDYVVQYNVMFAGGPLWGSASGVDSNNVFSYNKIYNPTRPSSAYIWTYLLRSRGYDNINAGENWTFQNNLTWHKGSSEATYNRHRIVNVSNNTIVGGNSVFRIDAYSIYSTTITHDNNTYYTPVRTTAFVHPGSGPAVTLADWQAATGYDLNSTFTQALPTSNDVTVLADDYTNGRGIISVFNFLGSSSVSADLTALNITDGARCRMYNALNKSEYVDFTYDADSPTLSIDMQAASWSVSDPTAFDWAGINWFVEPFPDFGAFLVEQIDTGDALTVPARDIILTVLDK